MIDHVSVSLRGVTLEIHCPSELTDLIASLFGGAPQVGDAASSSPGPIRRIDIGDDGPARYSIEAAYSEPQANLSREELVSALLEESVHSLVFAMDDAVALHAASVETASGLVLIPGKSGAGKSTLAAWMTERGFVYASDELTVLGQDGSLQGFARPLVVKPGARGVVEALSWVTRARTIESGGNLIVLAPSAPARPPVKAGLIVFPSFEPGSALKLEPLTPARTALQLMECNLNARNLPDHGLALVRALALATPAIRLTYGAIGLIEGVLDVFVSEALEARPEPRDLPDLLQAFLARITTKAPPAPAYPPATPGRGPVRLTIGMATYDDYDGVYFTVQALRLYHPETLADTEFLVVDNNPGGKYAAALERLSHSIPNFRYIPFSERSGTAVRDHIFKEAEGRYVLCIDCHVLLAPGAIRRLVDYFEGSPETADLLQGPLIYDDLKSISTHFDMVWRNGMLGVWGTDPRGLDPDGEPFDIVSQGLGLFACRRDAWPGFNHGFRGFGGEEGYIHEKFRRLGGRTLCLPFLRWMHRFERPAGVPYRNKWEDRILNYLIGHRELGLDTVELEAHFIDLLGEEPGRTALATVRAELEKLTGLETRHRPEPANAP